MCSTCGDNGHDDLNDDISSMFGSVEEFRSDFNLSGEAKPGFDAKTDKAIEDSLHYEPCSKCRGTGRFIGYTGRALGPCYTCKGAGKIGYKQTAATRAASRESAAARKQKAAIEAAAPWISGNAVMYGWLLAGARQGNGFYQQMLEKLVRFSSLTERQMAAIQRDMDREADKGKAVVNAPVLDKAFDRVIASFDQAREKAVKLPKMRLGEFYISWNPKAIYVKSLVRTDAEGGREYLGKIVDGKFFRARACTDEDQAALLAVVADPEAAANAYGQRTGTCSICGLELTAAESIERSIGPICWGKYFG